MKTKLLIGLLSIAMPGFSQTDMYGVQISGDFESEASKTKTLNPLLSAYTYDSVRVLSEINDPADADAYPWISGDGLRLYYTSGANNNQLAYTSRPNVNSLFGTPAILPITVSSPSSYWLSANELDVYICTNSQLYHATRTSTGSSFGPAATISLSLPGTISSIKGASLDSAQNRLFICEFGADKIYELSRTSATSFTYVRSLPFPTGYLPSPGQLSKDGLTYFTGAYPTASSKGRLYQFTRASVSDSFEISSFSEIQTLNDTLVYNSQPSMSDNLEWVAFVRASQNLWESNELYIAHKVSQGSYIAEPALGGLRVYPVPANDHIVFYSPRITEGILQIYNSSGQLILKQFLRSKTTIDTRQFAAGVYQYHLLSDKEVGSAGKFCIVR